MVFFLILLPTVFKRPPTKIIGQTQEMELKKKTISDLKKKKKADAKIDVQAQGWSPSG